MEKRRFQRFSLDAEARLSCDGKTWHSHLLDVSLKGALVATPEGWSEPASARDCRLDLLLSDEVTVTMQGTLMPYSSGHLGFRCDNIDLDSIAHLKRLVELNLGDESLLERELNELARAG